MRNVLIVFAFIVFAGLAILGFRGGITTRQPIEVHPDMDRQPRYQAQGESEFFSDGRADRLPPEGTVGRGNLQEDDHLYRGVDADGEFAEGFPGIVTREMMQRGQERFRISCAPCHGATGDGEGITSNYGMAVIADLHIDRIQEMPEGELFEVITNGRGLMGPYGGEVSPEDRWNIIAYLRALQRTRQGTVEDVPADQRAELGL